MTNDEIREIFKEWMYLQHTNDVEMNAFEAGFRIGMARAVEQGRVKEVMEGE
jgi:hypothetical protein